MVLNPKLAAGAQKSLGLPSGIKFYSPFPFAGVNLQASGLAIDDKEFLFLENYVRLGDGNLRTVWDAGTAIYNAPAGRTIVYFYFYTIGTTYYCAVFLDDGSAVQIDTTTLAQTEIGPIGTFYDSTTGQLPVCSQWGTLYLLIANRNTRNDYWAFDGSILYGAGRIAPDGVNLLSGGRGYTSAPTITVYGGYGSNIVVTPTLQGGQIVAFTVVAPGTGYQVGDVVQLAFSGGGSDDSAILTAALAASTVAGAVVTAGGSGYATATTTVTFSGGGGSGAAATAVVTDGVVTDITITNIGSGYTTAPTVTISGNGVGATAIAKLLSTGVASGTVVNGGSGFTSVPTISFVGGDGAGATGLVKLTATTVASINVTAGGTGYTSAPTVTVTGIDGTGATATATVADGQVSHITVTAAGSGFTGVPTVTFSGGGGTGAAAEAVLTPTSIGSVVIQNVGQFYTTAPAIAVSSGSNNAAYATLSFMPYGVSGAGMETFQSRVWLVDPADPQFGTQPPGGNFAVSAPGSLIDFATSSGGVLYTSSDNFLQTRYTGVRQSNGYLYFFGDGSVSVVSNVQTSGSPATTTFNYQNVDPQSGLSWRDSRQDFGRSIVLANETGFYGLYGGSVAKISDKLNAMFGGEINPNLPQAVFPPDAGALTPSAAVATLFDVRHYLCLMTVKDQVTSAARNIMLTWNEREWSFTSQSVDLTFIGTQKVESKLYAWGTDGSSLYPLFSTPSSSLTKRLYTKDYGGESMFIIKDLMAMWMQVQDRSTDNAGVSFDGSLIVSGLASQGFQDPSVQALSLAMADSLIALPSTTGVQSAYPYWPLIGAGTNGVPFVTVSARLTSTSPDFTIGHLALGYMPEVAVF